MFVQFCFALLALSSLTAASDPGCDELIKPLEDRSKVYGKWIFYAATSDNEEELNSYKITSSSWSKVSPIPDSDEFIIDGNCVYGSANSIHFNSTAFVHVGNYLETCAECVLWSDEASTEINGAVRKSRNLYFFTKTGKLDPSDLETLKKQAKCLNLLPDFYFPGTTNLCPEESEPTAASANANAEEQ
uniref:Apolipoprotein M n=1 Tax=Poecilia latipinna TaxID=48699 RepID=A0A3B3UTE7_9TELE